MSLRDYLKKRDFSRTREPRGGSRSSPKKTLRFVVQKHDASRLHYDFRLEINGTLKSWAVPKGIPYKKGEKRLAVQVEDHPIGYAGFEGVIPKGQYGGGTVMLWDSGTFASLGGQPAHDLANGKLHFTLHGKKLNGEWTLIQIRGEEGKQWLLLKSGDDVRSVSKRADNASVTTGRTMTAIARDKGDKGEAGRSRKKSTSSLKFVEPMKAKLVAEPPTSGDWLYELKFDGFRAIAVKQTGEVKLYSRNKNDLGARFPEIRDAFIRLSADDFICDGEIVALDARGHSSFQLLQGNASGDERPPIVFYAFDLLQLGPDSLMARPLDERRRLLEKKVLRKAKEPLRFSATLGHAAKPLLKQIQKHGLEGLIGKRAESPYESGRRSGAWIKLKCLNEQEFVIGGFTPPKGERDFFGALLVGYYERKILRFAGKVGTGFDSRSLPVLHKKMIARRAAKCPFPDLPEKSSGRWAQNITARDMASCTWVKPALVCQLKFAEWTREGKLRHGVFLGLRDDKPAREVRREQAR